MRNTFVSGLTKLAERDRRIFLMTGDLGYGVLDEFQKKYPDRYINAGISEQNMMSVAAGIALEGNIVFTYSIANFPTLRCLEQIRNDVCYHNANVKIVSVGAGMSYGQLGMSHHATEDIAIMRALPNMRVFSPADPQEAIKVLEEAYRLDNPVYIRLGKGKEKNNHPQVQIENIYKLLRLEEGSDVCIIATGSILSEVLEAQKILSLNNISTEVCNAISLKPIDIMTIQELSKKFGLLVTVEEHNIIGGLGSALLEALYSFDSVKPKLLRIGLQDQYTNIVGSHDFLCDYYGLSALKIAEKIKKAWESKQ